MAKELVKKAALLMALGLISLVQAASQGDHHATLVDKLHAGEYSRRGADICLGCHDETYPFPTNQIFRTTHGRPNAGSPFAVNNNPARFPVGLQCEACHGPAGKHGKQILEDNEHRLPMINFGRHANAAADLQNSMCLSCHDDYQRHNWFGSEHEVADISCTDCHKIHHDRDPVQQLETQVDTCNICHTGVAADIVKHSAHPMRNNQLICENCHQVHGNTSEKLMSSATLNDTCYTCHAEKRGPFLYEHEPVVEDCSICHVPHGANQPSLLVRRPPQLCQGCHSAAGHRNFPGLVSQIPPNGASEYLIARGCMNCHSEVHGSNHPSGDKLRR